MPITALCDWTFGIGLFCEISINNMSALIQQRRSPEAVLGEMLNAYYYLVERFHNRVKATVALRTKYITFAADRSGVE